MKIIVAGLPKTGTKSMTAALNLLGYEVYDWMENFWYFGDDWIRQLDEGFKVEDMRRMYENVDAVADNPCCFYWEEIFDAFPDAKVILTYRDEEVWCRSLRKQVDNLRKDIGFRMLRAFTYSGRKLHKYAVKIGLGRTDVLRRSAMGVLFGSMSIQNDESIIKMYRRHNREVQHVVPKNQLLVYQLKDGWGPLCNFLDIPIPDIPFPHKNQRGEVLELMRKENPVMRRLEKEFKISLACLLAVFGFGIYKAARYVPWSSLTEWFFRN